MIALFTRATRHWLLALNLLLGTFLAGAFAAPVLAVVGWTSLAASLYALYHLACHQWAFRSFFLFGSESVYSQDGLASLGLDPFTFAGSGDLGWKIAVCERDLAIYFGLLGVGLFYARSGHRLRRTLTLPAYCLLALPMALDGFTQLFGWRESTWELRVATGLLFGVASAWLVLPRLEEALTSPGQRHRAYAPVEAKTNDLEPACEPPFPTPAAPRG